MHAIFSKTLWVSNLISQPTCYKNPEKPSSIDMISTNSSSNFQNSSAVETGLCDFSQDDYYGYEVNLSEVKAKIDLLP